LIKPLMRWAFSRKEFTADLYPLGALGVGYHVRSLERFFEDAANGTLPPFSIVDPDFRCFSEENPQDIRRGESFAAAVIGAVMSGKGWPNTLLIWTYDEHGGYFDHVSPPEAVPPDDVPGQSILSWLGAFGWLFRRFGWWNKLQLADRLEHHAYDRYGFRVPAVIVSPYARPGYVSPEEAVFDHTSILKLVETKWSLPPLTARDANAGDLTAVLDLDSPNPPFAAPPVLADPALPWKGVRAATRARA